MATQKRSLSYVIASTAVGVSIGGLLVQFYFYLNESPRFDPLKVQIKVVFLIVGLLWVIRAKAKATS
jgi:hypothetical protein